MRAVDGVGGHQPGLGTFAWRLLGNPPDDPDFAKYVTGATAIIDFDVDDWPEIDWETGRLADFVAPRSLE